MKEELETRDYSDVSSDKLLDYLSKTLNQLKQDETEFIFNAEGDTVEDLITTMNTVTWSP
ncbi:hypothetical protein [Bacillus mycoides]|uniref:hypothetical protein n=1 Tax=Bacillus mycoides TaxID=1405 RepID=UPI003D6569CB